MSRETASAISALLFIALSLGFAYAVSAGTASIINGAMLNATRTLEAAT